MRTLHEYLKPSVEVIKYYCVCYVLSHFSHVWLFATLWTAAHRVPGSMRFSRQKDLSGLPFPSPRDLPDSGIKCASHMSHALAGPFFTTWEARYSGSASGLPFKQCCNSCLLPPVHSLNLSCCLSQSLETHRENTDAYSLPPPPSFTFIFNCIDTEKKKYCVLLAWDWYILKSQNTIHRYLKSNLIQVVYLP